MQKISDLPTAAKLPFAPSLLLAVNLLAGTAILAVSAQDLESYNRVPSPLNLEFICNFCANLVELTIPTAVPTAALLAIFIGLKLSMKKQFRRKGTVIFVIGTVVIVSALFVPGRLQWIYATLRDLNPLS